MARLIHRPAVLAVATALIGVGALSACSTEPVPLEVESAEVVLQPQSEPEEVPEPQTQSEEPPQSTEQEAPPIEEEYWTESSIVDPGESAAEPALITDLRVGEQDGYDRVVVELTGSGPVGWNIQYTDQALEQGRGEAIEVPGAAILDVNITGTSIPVSEDDYAVYFQGDSASSGNVTAVYDSSFEGNTHVVIGLDKARPFDAYMLLNPLRVVIDIQQ